jgi:MinD-like ATPase involved in chromosome partitioning or flagellar assembly
MILPRFEQHPYGTDHPGSDDPQPRWNPDVSAPRHGYSSGEDQPPVENLWEQQPFPVVSTAGGQWTVHEHLRPSDLVEGRKFAPSRGWRYWIYRTTFKQWNLGESPDERHERVLIETIAAPLRGTYSIAVVGAKGGVGKTTESVGIGSTFAGIRKDKVIAIDADPSQGANLADRVDSKAKSSIHEVNKDAKLFGYTDIRSHVGQNKVGLDVLASAQHVSSRASITADALKKAHQRLQRFYSILLMDCGVNFDDPVMPGVLAKADAIVVVASVAVDGAVGADAALRWLHQEGYNQLLSRLVVVINEIRPTAGGKDRKNTRRLITSMTEYFSKFVKPEQIFVMPFDEHIATTDVLELNELAPAARRRFLEITTAVARGFAATTDAR